MIPRETLKKIRRIEIRTRRSVHDVFAGRYHSVFKGQGMEFQEVREYVPGDDIRAIDWNVTARTGIPHVKKFTEERELTVMLLVDISASNLFGSTTQLKRDLIAEVAAVLAFSAITNHDRVGLILFGSQAYLQAPLTFDRHTVRTWLDEARIGIAGKNTAIGDAIGLAVKRLRQRPAQSRVLILVTDGANNGGQIDPLTAARLAAEEGVRIYPIGVGSDPQENTAKGLFSINPGVDLDEPAMEEIAHITGGRYFRARDGNELAAIKDTLDQLEPVAQQPTQARPAQALYSWPLSGSLLLSVLLVIRELWPNHPLQRLLSKEHFLPHNPDWRSRLKRLRLRRRR